VSVLTVSNECGFYGKWIFPEQVAISVGNCSPIADITDLGFTDDVLSGGKYEFRVRIDEA
jgi:hypothetical protein